MSLNLKKPQLLLLLALLSILGSCSHERTKSVLKTTKSVSGAVVKIVDGDTITILDSDNIQHRIRLQGIDAPERRQDFGAVSREHLGSLVFGKQVRIEYDKTDWRGRLIGKVWLDGNDECLEQLKAGFAWHYKEYEQEQSPADRQGYASAEQEARSQRLGLWKDPTPTPPWEYRHHSNGSTVDAEAPDDPTSDSRRMDSPSPRSTLPPVERNLTNAAPLTNDSPTNAQRAVANTNPISVRPNVDRTESGLIRGNKRSMIYHWPGCPNYDDIAPHNRVFFQTRVEAETIGYRAARNCP
jgi:endonuclease YncB( thermonuclease family)